jgi:hypothetical protein
MAQAASDVAISKHRSLFTQTRRQGLEEKMTSEEYDSPLLCLETADLLLKGQLLCRGYENTAMTP